MKRKGKKKRIGLKIVCCLLAAVLIAALAMFGRLGLTILGVKCDPENGVYVIDYREDYKLQQLLDEGGVTTQDELAKYLIRILLKPIKGILKFLAHALFGYVLLFVVSFLGDFIGIDIQMNLINVLVAGFFGIPGVIVLALASFLF